MRPIETLTPEQARELLGQGHAGLGVTAGDPRARAAAERWLRDWEREHPTVGRLFVVEVPA